MKKYTEQIKRALLGRSPVMYLQTPEENRVTTAFPEILRELHRSDWGVLSWSCVQGIQGLPDTAAAADTRNPVDAVRQFSAMDFHGILIMKDLAPFMNEVQVRRSLREFYARHADRGVKFIAVLSPELVLPPELQKEIRLIIVPPPDTDEINGEFQRIQAFYPERVLAPELLPELILALKGMTVEEIAQVLHRIFQCDAVDNAEILEEVFLEKEMIVRKSGYLEFTPPRWQIADIGGLDNLKEWLVRRKKVFSQDAVNAGIPVPKGLLVMGISGCGKSLAVKAISSLWNIPLFRLDMNLVFSGLYGSPEAAFNNALQTVESVAPAILWIDEIENALGIEEKGLKIASHVFSSFLTWMQEKPQLVFIAATANNIHALPAEIIRKGRFDQVFFIDLPNKSEIHEILEIHMQRNSIDPTEFDLKMLSLMMEGWNGAEVEQAVIGARTDAYFENRQVDMNDISNNILKIVPLSQTMEQQIKSIRSWAFTRATPASKYAKVGRR